MYNEKRVKLIQRLALVVLFVAGTLAGFGLGQLVHPSGDTRAPKTADTVKKSIEGQTKKKVLSAKDVERFLIAYYTKKDLSENRKRYKPLMTSTLYTQETTIEDLPINQAYKGYVINQVFDEAAIYIDRENLVALVEVKYHNTQLVEKGTTDGALVDTPETQTLKLTFTEENKQFKVNAINKIFLTTTGETPRNNTYEEESGTAESNKTSEDKETSSETASSEETGASDATKTTTSSATPSSEPAEKAEE